MRELSYVRKIVISAMCVSLCTVLPMAFHLIPNLGSVASPMHIPVLLCGVVCGWSFGLMCGLAGPALSSFVTGMPMAAVLPSMMAELAVYGAVTGFMMKVVRTGNKYADLYVCLLTAMLAGRVVAGITRALIFDPGGYTFALWVGGYFVSSLPGIIMQLILIPVVYRAFEKSRLLPARY